MLVYTPRKSISRRLGQLKLFRTSPPYTLTSLYSLATALVTVCDKLKEVKLGRSRIPAAGLEKLADPSDIVEIRREIFRVRSLVRSMVLKWLSQLSRRQERFEEIYASRNEFEATPMQILDVARTDDLLVHEFRHVGPVLQYATSLWEAVRMFGFEHNPHFLALKGFQPSELGEVDWAVER